MKKIDNTDFFSQVHEFLLEGKSIRINIRGNSMKPFLREGSHQAEIAPTEGRNLKTGDVVLFRHCSRYVLHRIVAINDERYTMQGDGNRIPRGHNRSNGAFLPQGRAYDGLFVAMVEVSIALVDTDAPRKKIFARPAGKTAFEKTLNPRAKKTGLTQIA